jgi:glycosyltransferase involved in cell wall biosynthesis
VPFLGPTGACSMTERVVINDFISVRGNSGSSRGATYVRQALGGGFDVLTVAPTKEPRHRVTRLAFMLVWDFVLVPWKAWRARAGVVVHCTNTGWSVLRAKSVVVMHDTMVLDHPAFFGFAFRFYAHVAFAISARAASVIVTPSHHSREQILRRWPKSRVVVIPWPAERVTAVPETAVARERVLVVASADRHKRLPLAVSVVEKARTESGRDLGLDLVVRSGNDELALASAIEGREAWVRVQRGVPEGTLDRLYRDALCVLVTSIDEGFCLPAVEAAVRATPVVHSNTGALPEVAPLGDWVSELAGTEEDRLTNQVVRLLDHDLATAEAARLREHATRAFSPQAVATAWRQMIEALS